MKKKQWRIHTSQLLKEALGNKGMSMLTRPFQLLGYALAEVATRASQLNDPELDRLMIKLSLYEVADGFKKDEYDPNLVQSYMDGTADVFNEDPEEVMG